ncbi:MAG: ribonuclease H family protein [Lachnospiraceae bacterium]|nr:ribonuclease H family protein [Lachnospiraceae bacterium]MDE6251918.1 ribonuclease H family protein [Lachnospiraceae bacterium]
MAKKYYAVRKGKVPGIYMTWNDCKSQVDGFSGAEYKSFASLEEAAAFVDGGGSQNISVDIKDGIPVSDEYNAIAYVDGSYNNATKEFSYGVVMFHDGKEIHFSQKVEDKELAEMRNVAGEIKGAECAMRYAVEHGCKTLVIYHDYEGIAKWCTGVWKTNKEGTQAYKAYFDSIKDSIKIDFKKVKGHSGDLYNDKADELAKKAIFN